MDPFTAAALITGGAGIVGGLMQNQNNTSSAREATQASRDMSSEQMAFQERMSSTAHQREVADLKAAGLNAILSVNAGSSTPAGAMGTAQAAKHENVLASAGEAARFAAEAKKNKAEIGLMEAQKRKADNEAVVISKEIPKAETMNKVYRLVEPQLDKLLGMFSSSSKTPPLTGSSLKKAHESALKKDRELRDRAQQQQQFYKGKY